MSIITLPGRFRALAAVALAALTSLAGLTPARAQWNDFTSEIIVTAAAFCREGTQEAAGAVLPIRDHTSLHSLFGTEYGGNGYSTFALPDLRAPAESRVATGTLRWCAVLGGDYPRLDGNDERHDGRLAGEVIAVADWQSKYGSAAGLLCPDGWSRESDASLPHQAKLNWCRAGGWGGQVNSYIGQMLLVANTICPDNSLPADGRTLPTGEHEYLGTLIGNAYGGDRAQGTYALPDISAPQAGMRWCIVTDGRYPAAD